MCIMACGFLFKPGGGPVYPPAQGSCHPHKALWLGSQMAQSRAMWLQWLGVGGKAEGIEGIFHPLSLSVIAAGNTAARINETILGSALLSGLLPQKESPRNPP